MLVEADIMVPERLTALMQEADELIAIFVATIKTTRRNSHTQGKEKNNGRKHNPVPNPKSEINNQKSEIGYVVGGSLKENLYVRLTYPRLRRAGRRLSW